MDNNLEKVTTVVQGVQTGFHYIAVNSAMGFALEKAKVSLLTRPTEACVMATVGTVGDIRSGVAISFDERGFAETVSKMSFGLLDGSDDEMSISCIAEMTNMISGKLAVFAESRGYRIDVTPPQVFRGEKIVQIYPSNVRWIFIPYRLDKGNVFLNVLVDEKSREISSGKEYISPILADIEN